MIPKIIHYCWFGKGKKSPLINKCIESWNKYCPDYKIIEWNEENFDINNNRFTKEAYESRKYAFVSDYVRLYVLNKYGGVYVDTDLEIRKNIDIFLKDKAFSSFESKDYIPTAIMGAEKGHPWIRDLLEYYENRQFILDDGTLDMTPNPKIITEITIEKYGLVLNNKEQVLKEGLHIYSDYVLCSNNWYNRNYSIHHFDGSWLDKEAFYKEQALKYKKNYTILVEILEKTIEQINIDFPIQNYDDIYIFGAGYISKYLVDYLDQMGFNLKGIISRENKETIYGKENFHIDNIEHVMANDLIIVVPSFDFNKICEELSIKTNAELVSIEYFFGVYVKYV